MKIRHSPHHWIAVAVVLAVLLLTLSEPMVRAAGGRTSKAGRRCPARKRAKAPWQDRLKAAIAVENSTDMQPRRDVKPSRDQSLAKDERSA